MERFGGNAWNAGIHMKLHQADGLGKGLAVENVRIKRIGRFDERVLRRKPLLPDRWSSIYHLKRGKIFFNPHSSVCGSDNVGIEARGEPQHDAESGERAVRDERVQEILPRRV